MKLALAHYSSSADISGVTTWFERLVLRLQNNGIELFVQLHHFGDNPHSASILPVLEDSRIAYEIVQRGSSLKEDVFQTLNFLNRIQPTIFLPQCLNSHYIAAAIAGKQGLPWVFTIHSDDPSYWTIASALQPATCGGKIVSVSKHIAHLVSESAIDVCSNVIPYGVEIPSQISNLNESAFRVVYIGRMVETQKRLSLVTSALIHACKSNSKIHVTLIGDGPSQESCTVAVKNAELSHRITFAGRLPPEQVKKELLKAQAILLMSDYEGLPVALLEAMAAGVVPVAREIPSGIPELVHHERTGLLVNDQPEVAARSLSRLANDPLLWQTCSTAARQLVVDQYSEDVCHQHWLAFIETLQSKSTIRYPLHIPKNLDLSSLDPTIFAGYPVSRAWYLRTASKLKRKLSNVGQFFGS